MSVWDGFPADLLKAAHCPTSNDNQSFIEQWSISATSSCQNNPVDISHKQTGSSNCQKLTSSRTAQKYPNHSDASNAFASELQSGNFPDLLKALVSGTPNTYKNKQGVVDDVKIWGSAKFATWLAQNYLPVGPPAGSVSAPRAHQGWADIRRSVNKNWPAALHQSDKQIRVALRSLSHARKVRL